MIVTSDSIESVLSCGIGLLLNYPPLFKVDALFADGSKFEANHGEDVTLPFTMDKAERADRLRVTFTSETTKCVIAQLCDPSDGCAVVNTPGVSLNVGQGRVFVTIQRVDISRSGLYKALAFFGKDVCEVKATLVVNEAPVSSTIAPPHSSTPNPLNSDLLWLCALIPLVILGGVCFWIYRRKRESADEDARETPAVSRSSVSRRKNWKNNCSECVAVAMNDCGENPGALLAS